MEEYIVDEKRRKALGDFIKNLREKQKLGLNQFSLKIGITSSLYSRLENGKLYKINPFFLQKIATGLKIDYKVLYEKVGYLEKKDLGMNISNIGIENSSNVGNINIGDKNYNYNNAEIKGIEVLSTLTEDELKKVIEYAEFLKMKREKDF